MMVNNIREARALPEYRADVKLIADYGKTRTFGLSDRDVVLAIANTQWRYGALELADVLSDVLDATGVEKMDWGT